MNSIPKEKIAEITSRIDLSEIIGEFVTLKPNGNRLVGLCPFHSEKSPSFNVNVAQGFYHCFGCKESGDAIKFLMKLEGLSFLDAVEKLAARAGVSLEKMEVTAEDLEKQELTRLFYRISTSFSYCLDHTPEAQTARELLQKRKITEKAKLDFQLGYAPKDRKWLYKFLLSKNYSRDFLAKTGLFSQKYPEISLFSNRLIFPIKNARQEVIAFGGRVLDPNDNPKYLNSPENLLFKKRQSLYGIDSALPKIRTSRSVFLCEGYMDVIALHMSGIVNAVAPLGTALTEDHVQFLKRYAEKVYLLFDSDSAGQNATVRSLEILERYELESFVFKLADAKDPAEIFENDGPEALNNSLKNPINSFEFLLNFHYSAFHQGSTLDLIGLLRTLFKYLDSVKSEVKKETLLTMMSGFLKVSKESLAKDYYKKESSKPTPPQVKATQVVRNRINKQDFLILLAVFRNLELFPVFRRDLTADDLDDDQAKLLFLALDGAFQAGETGLAAISARLPDEGLRQEVLERLTKGEFDENSAKIVHDGIVLIRKRSLERKRLLIMEKLNQQGLEGSNPEVISLLLQEKKFLDGEINKLKVFHND